MSKNREWFEAVLGGRWEEAKRLLAGGADIDARDRDGRTALLHAVLNSDRPGVEWLLGAGADMNLPDRTGKTALHYAAQQYDGAMVEALAARGATIDARDEHGNTPLFRAVFESRGRGDVIGILLRHGADPDLENSYGSSPRTLAHTIGNYDVASFLP